jgi:lactate dehydrogenase-like 2-hydroxyacid dehydrogenase
MEHTGSGNMGEKEFEHLPKLKMITSCSVGIDMFDIEAAKARGIIICNQPGRT